ncbi:MAG TPA: hypothetical protein VFO83_08385, partial [Aggregicoccus sp.]|nr:hypothetical protein [Aggregicoccus sp.]
MALFRSLPLQALALGALCVLGCRQWAAAPAPAPEAAHPAPAPQATVVSLSFEGGLLEHYRALPLLEAHGLVATFRMPREALGTPSHMNRLQLGLVEESGHRVVLEEVPTPCGGEPLPGTVELVLDGTTPLVYLASAITRAETRGGGRVDVILCGLEEGQGFETLAHFLGWLAPRAQTGTHVRLA